MKKQIEAEAMEMAMEVLDKTSFSKLNVMEKKVFLTIFLHHVENTVEPCKKVFDINPESDCNSGKCPGEKREKCLSPAKEAAEKVTKPPKSGEKPAQPKKDRFGAKEGTVAFRINAVLTGEKTKKEIAEELGISEQQVAVHVSHLRNKLGFLVVADKENRLKLKKPRTIK